MAKSVTTICKVCGYDMIEMNNIYLAVWLAEYNI